MKEYPQSITVTLSPKNNSIVREYCESIGLPLNRFINMAVEKYLESLEQNERVEIIEKYDPLYNQEYIDKEIKI